MEDFIDYHEDFYLQIELIPEENYFKIQRDISGNIATNEVEHGFITVNERQEHIIKTESLNIKLVEATQLLHPFLIKYFDTVTTGYGDAKRIRQSTCALGFERIALFFESNKSGIIKNIWLCQSTLLPIDAYGKNLINALLVLGRTYGLILIDWNEEVVVRLTSEQAIQKYLRNTFSFTLPS